MEDPLKKFYIFIAIDYLLEIKKNLLLALSSLDIVFIIVGISILVYQIVMHHLTIADALFSSLFMLANLFFGVQSIAYILNYLRSLVYYPGTTDNYLIKRTEKKVAVLVPLYNENVEMVRENISAVVNTAGDIANVYVLDDSTNGTSEMIKKICEGYNIAYVHRTNRRGYKAGALNDVIKTLREEFIAVIDIDQMPDPNFIKGVIPILESADNIAYVQLPQFYANTDAGVISRMASGQQFIFYEILTEGKSVLNTLFSCGTNLVYRKKALEDVGYFDETNITEDIATSIKMLEKGYKGIYYNKKLVYGRAPTTFEGYVNQQYRWAFGSLGLMKSIMKNIVASKKFSRMARFDWFVTSTWFLFGWFYLVFLIAPILATIGIKVLSISPFLYLVAWLPYSVLILSVFFITHIEKGAPISTIFYNMSVNVVLFTLSISVTLSLLMGKKKGFVTARTGGTLPWYKFTPQFIIMFFLAFSAVLLVVKGSVYNYITAFWALFDFVLLLPIFFMNREPKNSLMDSALLVKN